MKPRQSATRNRMFALPEILLIGALLLLAGSLAPLLATQAATVDTANAAPTLHQVVPTPTPGQHAIEPLPTEEPTPTPSPTADPSSVIRLDPDNATVIPVDTEDDGNDVIRLDPDSDSVIGIDFEVAPTPTPDEPTPFPEEETDEPGVRVVVRWCPFGTELGGPRVNHPLIERLCTLDGPNIKVDLTRADGQGETHSGGASKTFPANIDLKPVKPGRWLLEVHPSVQVDLSALYCRNGDQLVEAPSLKPGLPVFEIDLGESEDLECSWYGEAPEDATAPPPRGDESDRYDLMIFKWLCPEGTKYDQPITYYANECGLEHPGVDFHLTHDDGEVNFVSDLNGVYLPNLRGHLIVKEIVEPGYGVPVVFCETPGVTEPTLLPPTDGDVEISPAPGDVVLCHWYNIPDQSESDEKSDADKQAESIGAVEVTTHQCKGIPPRGADYGWFNKNCAAFPGPFPELTNGRKDGVVQLEPTKSSVGYTVNTAVPAGTYLLMQTGGTPLNVHAVWCATLTADQMPSPSDYVQVPITRAGISITVEEGTWMSCKVFGPAIRGNLEPRNHFLNASFLQI